MHLPSIFLISAVLLVTTAESDDWCCVLSVSRGGNADDAQSRYQSFKNDALYACTDRDGIGCASLSWSTDIGIDYGANEYRAICRGCPIRGIGHDRGLVSGVAYQYLDYRCHIHHSFCKLGMENDELRSFANKV